MYSATLAQLRKGKINMLWFCDTFIFRRTLMECSKGNSPSQSRWGKVKSFFSFFIPLVSWWTYIPEFINRTPLSGYNAKFQWKTAVFGIEIGVWVKHHFVSTFGSNTTRELPGRLPEGITAHGHWPAHAIFHALLLLPQASGTQTPQTNSKPHLSAEGSLLKTYQSSLFGFVLCHHLQQKNWTGFGTKTSQQ